MSEVASLSYANTTYPADPVLLKSEKVKYYAVCRPRSPGGEPGGKVGYQFRSYDPADVSYWSNMCNNVPGLPFDCLCQK